jgi:eukaryotic-like serine/threonine-protein kinase
MTAPTTFCNECGASNLLQATHCFACNVALQPLAPIPLLQVQAASTSAAVPTSKVRGSLAQSFLLHSRYSIASQIGTGGFGAVYQAKDTLFSHRLVAIKEMNQDGLSPQELAEATAAFEHEALLLTGLTHPNLPRVHDHFSEHGRSYVVMDFIAGDTLEDYLDKYSQRLPVEMILDIGLQLCSVLGYLHAHQPPIIFRDLKPANIMRTADNHVYLIDFGIARHFKPGKAKDTIPLGSKGYAAPEQYGKAQTTCQSDIYGLGATLHQLLTGDDPSLALFHFEPVPSNGSPIFAQLNVLLAQMVEMEMSKRPASMAIVQQELQRLLAQQAGQKSSPVVKRRTFLRGCLSAVATCSAGIAIATLIVEKPNVIDMLLAHPFTGTTPAHSLSPATHAQATHLSKPLHTYRGHTGSVTAVAWSSHGQYIASAGTLDSSVQVWDANTGMLVIVPDLAMYPAEKRLLSRESVPALFATNGQRVDALAWSSDSIHLAAALGNDTVDSWNIETGDERLFRFGLPGDVNALAWSPGGSRIAAVSGNSAVQVRSATTGKLIFMYTEHAQAVLTLAWSPDGQHIASGAADGIVKVWDASTGHTSVTHGGHTAAVNAVSWSPDSSQIASGGTGGTVQVWDAATGRSLFTYRGHAGAVNTVAWQVGVQLLPGAEARIASGGADDTVQVWSIGPASNQAMALQGKILVYRGHAGQVTSVTWSPDGQYIASGSEDGTVQIWRAV